MRLVITCGELGPLLCLFNERWNAGEKADSAAAEPARQLSIRSLFADAAKVSGQARSERLRMGTKGHDNVS